MADRISISLGDMPAMDGVELIQRVPLFSKLSFAETARLRGVMRLERFPAGHRLIDQDALGQALYIVRSGELRVSRRTDRGGHGEELGRLGVGEVVGEMSLLDDLLTAADVVCVTDCEVLVIPRASFAQLVGADERLALKIYRSFCHTLCDRLRRANLKIAEGGMR